MGLQLISVQGLGEGFWGLGFGGYIVRAQDLGLRASGLWGLERNVQGLDLEFSVSGVSGLGFKTYRYQSGHFVRTFLIAENRDTISTVMARLFLLPHVHLWPQLEKNA